MAETVKDRILAFIDAKDLSQKRFEEATGLSNGYVNNIKSDPSTKALQKIIGTYPDLNLYWLLLGTGDMLISDKPTNSNPLADDYLAELKQDKYELKQQLIEKEKIIKQKDDDIRQKDARIEELTNRLYGINQKKDVG